MILLVRLLVALVIGIAGSWIVYAVARDSIPGNGYILVAGGVGLVGFLWFGATDWYRHFRQTAWQRRIDRMGRY